MISLSEKCSQAVFVLYSAVPGGSCLLMIHTSWIY